MGVLIRLVNSRKVLKATKLFKRKVMHQQDKMLMQICSAKFKILPIWILEPNTNLIQIKNKLSQLMLLKLDRIASKRSISQQEMPLVNFHHLDGDNSGYQSEISLLKNVKHLKIACVS